jgi:hypothetical protein
MTKSQLIAALKFLAIMPQAYNSRGPEWIVREMEKVAREYVTLAEGK